jgi:hypothetical protein
MRARAPLAAVALLSAGALARAAAPRNPIGYGTNLGNTLEAPHEGDWQNHYATAQYFEDQKGAGFSTVRIPVRWDLHMMESAPYTINATFMARIQEVVGWCLAPGLNCIINSHWDSWIDQNDTTVFQARLPRYEALWQQVGAAFEGASPALWFESYNEPENLSTADLNRMLATFYSALRPLHPDRLLILGWLRGMGASWIQEGNHSNWNAMQFNQSDPNLAVEVHSVRARVGGAAGLWRTVVRRVVPWRSLRRALTQLPLPTLLPPFSTTRGWSVATLRGRGASRATCSTWTTCLAT